MGKSAWKQPMNRRQFTTLALGTGVALTASGCQVVTSSSSSKPTHRGSAIKVPHTGAHLPTTPQTLKWMYGGPGAKQTFFDAWFPAYHKAHPNITVEDDMLPNNKISEVLPVALRNGTAPDVFQSVGASTSQLVAAGELAPLDDIVPNFAQWKKNLPFGLLVSGDKVFNGKTYAFPPSTNKVMGALLLYASEPMKRAGYDPTSSSFTWKEFRAAAKKITQQGHGNTYGLILGNDTIGSKVSQLAELAGALGGGLNWKTGQYDYTADAILGTLELLQAIQSDGSFFPGTLALTDQDARVRLPQGAAGMILNGAWCYPIWAQTPDFKFGVAPQPLPKPGSLNPVGYGIGGANGYSVYAKAPPEHKAIAGDMMYYLGTEQGQLAWATLDGAGDPAFSSSAVSQLLGSSGVDPHVKRSYEIYNARMRLAPSPLLRNPDNDQVELRMVPVKPSFNDVVLGVLTGQVTDAKSALTKLNQQSEQALDQAVTGAQKAGFQVSRSDWVFKNWDPTKDYVIADYKAVSR